MQARNYSASPAACHGKQRGQSGFQLSLLGFGPEFDFDVLAKESRGRRTSLSSPDQVCRGSSRRDSCRTAAANDWNRMARTSTRCDAGCWLECRDERPTHGGWHESATAHYSNGASRDVTRLSQFQSNEFVFAAVSAAGMIATNTITGESAVMTRYLNLVAVITVSVPLLNDMPKDVYENLPRTNVIDSILLVLA